MTLTYLRAAYAYELVKLLKCHLKGKTCRKLVDEQDKFDYSENKWPSASSAPSLGLVFIIFKMYIQQILRERLQDHWSSGLYMYWYKRKTNKAS